MPVMIWGRLLEFEKDFGAELLHKPAENPDKQRGIFYFITSMLSGGRTEMADTFTKRGPSSKKGFELMEDEE